MPYTTEARWVFAGDVVTLLPLEGQPTTVRVDAVSIAGEDVLLDVQPLVGASFAAHLYLDTEVTVQLVGDPATLTEEVTSVPVTNHYERAEALSYLLSLMDTKASDAVLDGLSFEGHCALDDVHEDRNPGSFNPTVLRRPEQLTAGDGPVAYHGLGSSSLRSALSGALSVVSVERVLDDTVHVCFDFVVVASVDTPSNRPIMAKGVVEIPRDAVFRVV